MSKEAITKVVQRAISDAAFRRQLSTDPTGALRGFDLSADETAAIRAGDAGRLSAMGVDQRMSKAFALGGATVGASRAAGSDMANASSAMASDPAATTAGARDGALVSSTLSENDALISEGASARAGIIPTEPHIKTADADGAVASASRAISDDPDGFLAASDARATGGGDTARGAAINDDPDGFLAANAKWAAAPIDGSPEATVASRTGGETAARASAINDDPDGFLAANASRADGGASASGTPVEDSEGYLTSVGYDAGASSSRAVTDAHDRGEGAVSAAVTDAHDRGGGVNASVSSGGSAAGGETAYLDDSESYLSSIGTGTSDTVVTDAHDRGGENIVTRVDDDDAGGTSAASEDGPNISS
jgi:hypothetical protein